MNDSVILKINELIEYIKSSTEYKEYIYLKEKLNKNKNVIELITKIKQNQKNIVKKLSKKESIIELEKENYIYLEELKKIPLYVDYVNTQNILNDKYQYIKEKLDKYFLELLN